MAEWQTPKTDWVTNPKNPTAEDFNRIEGNIDFLKGDIETKKGAVVDALNTVGLETELTDTHAQIASKIIAANQGTKIITPGKSNITIPKGFHSGEGYVVGDTNLVPANIKKGTSIFGVQGSHEGRYTLKEQFLLNIMRLPEAPIGVDLNSVLIEKKTITITGSTYVPNGKTWYIPLLGQIFASNQGISGSTYNNTTVEVFEINLPSMTISDGGLSLGSNKWLLTDYCPNARNSSNLYIQSRASEGGIYCTAPYDSAYPRHLIPIPMINYAYSNYMNGFLIQLPTNVSTIFNIYQFAASETRKTVGTIPSNEMWLVCSYNESGNQVWLELNGNFLIRADERSFVKGPGTLSIYKDSTTSGAKVGVAILRLKYDAGSYY